MALGARCFYFSTLHQQFARTWIEAEQMCRDIGQGSTLASIRNQEEQDFINSKGLKTRNLNFHTFSQILLMKNQNLPIDARELSDFGDCMLN